MIDMLRIERNEKGVEKRFERNERNEKRVESLVQKRPRGML